MPKASASTGYMNGQACLYDFNCYRIAIHGLTISGIYYLGAFF